MLEKVFNLNDVSKSLNMEIFGHFRDYWRRIDQSAFLNAIQNEITAVVVASCKDQVIDFAVNQLKTFPTRDDYHELLELTIIFLGGFLSAVFISDI